MGVFNPTKFLESTTTDAGSTRLDPVPQGEYSAIIQDISFREIEIKRGEQAGKTRLIMSVSWELLDSELKAKLDRIPRVRQDIWIDQDDSGDIDYSKGKNVGLGRLREALGQNAPGQNWSPGMLKGAGPALLVVTERPDDNNADIIYNDVKSVGQIS